MIIDHKNTARTIVTLTTTLLTMAAFMIVAAGGAYGALAPIKESLTTRIGREVNQTTKGNTCNVATKETCQPGIPDSAPGTFEYPHGIAVNTGPEIGSHYGDVYVIDNTPRVQELNAEGHFLSMFGKAVNKKGGDTCTNTEESECQTGTPGAAPGQFDELQSVAVDPVNGDVYVAEKVAGGGTVGVRVQELTPEGAFLLEIGKEVNSVTKGNLCTAAEIANCTGPAQYASGGEPETLATEPGAFQDAGSFSLAVGGPQDLLYVGDGHRVQEFEPDGKYKNEISLESISTEPSSKVSALTVDPTGNIYLVYKYVTCVSGKPVPCLPDDEAIEHDNVVRKFNPAGEKIMNFTLTPREPQAIMIITGIAADSFGRLAVSERETEHGTLGLGHRTLGSLYDAGTGRRITEFSDADGPLAFSATGALYAAATPTNGNEDGHEVLVYAPLPVADLVTGLQGCVPGVDDETDATLDCTLEGEADPEGVSETEAFFQWGDTGALGEATAKQKVQTAGVVSGSLLGLRPNETFYYRLAGFDHNVQPPESALSGETVSFTTPVVAPRVLGELSVSFVRSSSVVMSGELNPENANTTYEFQYAPEGPSCETLDNCALVQTVGVSESSAYGAIGTSAEARGLQPGTTYRYRLLASDEHEVAGKIVGAKRTGGEGTFTTAPAAIPLALTGAATQVGTNTAMISGTVNPDGLPVTYTVELGVYEGAGTQYGVVFSGSAGSGAVPVEVSLGLTGLQPGTTYAYLFKIAGQSAASFGTFTTQGLPSVLPAPSSPAMLAVPNIAFPVAVGATKTVKSKKAKPKKAKSKKSKKARSRKTKHGRAAATAGGRMTRKRRGLL